MENEFIKRLVKWAKGEPQPPVSLEIWITSRCNLECKFCSRWRTKGWDRMDDKTIIRILMQAGIMGVQEVHLCGSGEPFLRRKTMTTAIRMVKQFGMKGFIVTNGTLLEEEDLSLLVHTQWDEIWFSIDGYSEQLHDFHRGVEGTFQKVIENISTLNHIKRRVNSKSPFVCLNSVITRKNFTELEKIIQLAKELECNAVIFQSLMGDEEKTKNLRIDNFELLREKVISAEKLSKELNMNTNIAHFLNPEYTEYANDIAKLLLQSVKDEKGFLSIPCYDPWHSMVITQDGRVGPCPAWTEKNKADVFPSSLKEIWYGDYFQTLREEMIKQKVANCEGCCTPKILHNNFLREELKKALSR